MKRHAARAACAFFLAAAGLLTTADWVIAQQQTTHPMVQRYNRTAKGENVEEWERRLGQDDAHTRLEAVQSLIQGGGEEAVRPLIEATADADPRVQIKAIDGLGFIADPAASTVLMQFLFLSNVDKQVKLRVLTALGRIADPATAQQLLQYAKTVNDEDLSCRAIYALGEIGDPALREELDQLGHGADNPDVRRLSQDAVSKTDERIASTPTQEPTLIELERMLLPPDQRKAGPKRR